MGLLAARCWLPVLLYTLALALLHRAGLAASRRAVRWAVIPLALALTSVGGGLLLLRRLLRLMDDPTHAWMRASIGLMLLCMIPLDALMLAGDGQRLVAVLLLLLLPIWLLGYRVPLS